MRPFKEESAPPPGPPGGRKDGGGKGIAFVQWFDLLVLASENEWFGLQK